MQQHHQQPQPPQPLQAAAPQPGPKPRGRRKKVRTEPIRPICPQCEKQFSNQSALTKHKLTHSDERRFACHQCSKAFKRHDHLTGHMQTHSNRKPFNCTIQGCDKTYCDARSLRRHKENIHHIVSPREMGSHNNLNQSYHDHHTHHHHHHHHHDHGPNGPIANGNHEIIGTITNGSGLNNHLHQLDGNAQDHLVCNKSHAYLVDGIADNSTGITTLTDLNNNNTTTTNTTADTNSNTGLYSGITIINADNRTGGDSKMSPTSTTYQTSTMPSSATSTENQIETARDTGSAAACATSNTNSSSTITTYLPQLSAVQTAQQHLQPSHLLRRRIERFHSDQGAYGSCNSDNQDLLNGRPAYLACSTTTSSSASASSHQNLAPLTHQPNGNNHHNQHNLHEHYGNNHQHASYSADYATNQHFDFEFNNLDNRHNHNHHQMDHAISSSTIPLSADSVTDSGLSLNVHYERYTPNHLQTTTPAQPAAPQTVSLAHAPGPLSISQHQQQQLYQRQQQQLQQQHDCYSAGYATTQHFDFDNQHASLSADYASTQTFNFDFTNINSHHMDHAISSSTIPLSADSVTDSGLALNAKYERRSPNQPQQQQQPPSQTQQIQQQEQQQQQQQPLYRGYLQPQHVSYSAGYAATQHFDFA